MGIVRLVLIALSLAYCSEIPLDDGTSMFRALIALFILLALDYSRMFLKGFSRYERVIGYIGFVYCLLIGLINQLGVSKQLVVTQINEAYYITSSATFRLLPNIKIEIDPYFQWTVWLTIFIAAFELTVPFVNRFNAKRSKEKVSETSVQKVKNADTPSISIDKRNFKEHSLPDATSVNKVDLEGLK